MSEFYLTAWGFTEAWAAEAAEFPGLFPGRVLSQHRDGYRVVCGGGEVQAEVSGRLRFAARGPSGFPAVGDFVLLDRENGGEGSAVIHRVLTRKSVFLRRAAGTSNDEQVVASNIDTVFICMSLNSDFNLRRLERYLSIGWDSGAVPVVVLTKADLCGDVAGRLGEVESAAAGADILVTSSLAGEGCRQVLAYLGPGRTAAFLGSSGVGKSTLINRLLGGDRLETSAIRDDGRGRHTTTRRELLRLENGGMVIDTPGMRELGLERADLGRSFSDIEGLAARCRFRDCTHKAEPGCAVQQAVQEGLLSAERLASYQKLKKEAKYEGLDSRQIENAKLDEMFKEVGGRKNVKKFIKEKQRRKGS